MSPGPITLDVPAFEARRYMAHKLRECARLLLQSKGSVSFHEDHSIERDRGPTVDPQSYECCGVTYRIEFTIPCRLHEKR